MKFPLIKNATVGTKLLTFMLLLIFGLAFSIVLGTIVTIINGSDLQDLKNLQITQIISGVVGFLMPAVVYAMLVQEKPWNYLGFKKIPTWSLLGIVAMLVSS